MYNSASIQIDFNNYPYLLTEEIYNRRGKKSKFTEQELWYLLFSLVAAKKSMADLHLKVGDIRPENVFLNEDGKIKVANLDSWPCQISNFQKFFEKKVTYLAPEDVKRLEMGGI